MKLFTIAALALSGFSFVSAAPATTIKSRDNSEGEGIMIPPDICQSLPAKGPQAAPVEGSCSLYYYCLSSSEHITKSCAPGEQFNKYTGNCDIPENVNCKGGKYPVEFSYAHGDIANIYAAYTEFMDADGPSWAQNTRMIPRSSPPSKDKKNHQIQPKKRDVTTTQKQDLSIQNNDGYTVDTQQDHNSESKELNGDTFTTNTQEQETSVESNTSQATKSKEESSTSTENEDSSTIKSDTIDQAADSSQDQSSKSKEQDTTSSTTQNQNLSSGNDIGHATNTQVQVSGSEGTSSSTNQSQNLSVNNGAGETTNTQVQMSKRSFIDTEKQ